MPGGIPGLAVARIAEPKGNTVAVPERVRDDSRELAGCRLRRLALAKDAGASTFHEMAHRLKLAVARLRGRSTLLPERRASPRLRL